MNAILLGKKLGMTQIFTKDGVVIPVTLVEAGPCTVTQIKTTQKDGYNAVQIGYGTKRHPVKPQIGHFAPSKTMPQFVTEFRTDDIESVKVGETLTVESMQDVKEVTVSGTSKGKGFAGVIKRHNFHRGPETHGSDHHRKPGSVGSMYPQHTLKGKRLPGHMGAARVTVQGLHVVTVDTKTNILAVRGAVPGANGSIVEIRGTK